MEQARELVSRAFSLVAARGDHGTFYANFMPSPRGAMPLLRPDAQTARL